MSLSTHLLRASHRTARNVSHIRTTLWSAYSSSSSKSHLGDPYSLPLSSETLARQPYLQEQAQELPPRLPRHNESIQTLRARLIYQSRKRGTLESDLLLSTFAAENIATMTEEDMKEFDHVRLLLLPVHVGFLNIFLSLWTNQTGMFITGWLAKRHHQSGGLIRPCWIG